MELHEPELQLPSPTKGVKVGRSNPNVVLTSPASRVNAAQLQVVLAAAEASASVKEMEANEVNPLGGSAILHSPMGSNGLGSQLPVKNNASQPAHANVAGEAAGGGGPLPIPNPATKKLRQSQHSSAMDDEHTLTKTECMATRRNLETGMCSFSSFSDSQVSSKISILGVSMGRDHNEVSRSVISLKNIEIDRMRVEPKGRKK